VLERQRNAAYKITLNLYLRFMAKAMSCKFVMSVCRRESLQYTKALNVPIAESAYKNEMFKENKKRRLKS